MKPRKRSEGPLLYGSLRVYRLLLTAYPRAFRQSYQDKLEQAFLDLCRDAVREGGMAFFGLWMSTLEDLARSVCQQRVLGGSMRRNVALISCVLAILFGYMIQAQAQFTVSAAATDPVPGWQRMELAGEDEPVWVSPTPSLTSGDIERAEPRTDSGGTTVISIQFTEEGSAKMRELSEVQIGRPIAMLLDGELIWAPVVRSPISAEAELSGGGPNGLTPEQIQRILASINE